jgi:hypothetical protein
MKTMSQKEIKHMLRSLPSYYEHMDTFKKSFIACIYGIFTVSIDRFEPLHILIMQNSIPTVPNSEMAYLFDMKGSSINREVFKSMKTSDLKLMKPT